MPAVRHVPDAGIREDLKLKYRTYICPEYGLVMDRDLNAAIKLANYKV